MNTPMDIIVDIICLLFIFETLLTFVFIINIYWIKIKRIIGKNDANKLHEEVEKILLYRTEDFSTLTDKDAKMLKKDMLVTLRIIEYLDRRYSNSPGWRFVRNSIVSNIIEPEAVKLSSSRNELNKYVSARLFLFHFNKKDTAIVESLIRNPSIFISISAAKVGFQYSDDILINVSIDVFSKYRRLQKSILSTIAETPTLRSEEIVIERLLRENDPYLRAFCYSIMMHFPLHENFNEKLTRYVKTVSNKILPPFPILQHLSEALLRDLSSNNLDLQLAALNYAGHSKGYQGLVYHFLSDPNWQVRATAARITGQIKDKKAIYILQHLLSDKEWWVRVRSAQALANIGEEGMKALRSLTPQSDKYAYEAAMQVLITSHHKEL